MTHTLTSGPLDTPRSYKRPVAEAAEAIRNAETEWANSFAAAQPNAVAYMSWTDVPKSVLGAAVVTRLNDLGFISELGLSALKAEKEGK
jgi:ribosomal protein S8